LLIIFFAQAAGAETLVQPLSPMTGNPSYVYFDSEGQAVVGASNKSLHTASVLFDDLSFPRSAAIMDFNESGQAVGSYGSGAFVYDPTAGFLQLSGDLNVKIFVFGLNTAGWVTGCIRFTSGTYQGFVESIDNLFNQTIPGKLLPQTDYFDNSVGDYICGGDIDEAGVTYGELDMQGQRVLFRRLPDSAPLQFANLPTGSSQNTLATPILRLTSNGELLGHISQNGNLRPFLYAGNNLQILADNFDELAVNIGSFRSAEVFFKGVDGDLYGSAINAQGGTVGVQWTNKSAAPIDANSIYTISNGEIIYQVLGRNNLGQTLVKIITSESQSSLALLHEKKFEVFKGPLALAAGTQNSTSLPNFDELIIVGQSILQQTDSGWQALKVNLTPKSNSFAPFGVDAERFISGNIVYIWDTTTHSFQHHSTIDLTATTANGLTDPIPYQYVGHYSSTLSGEFAALSDLVLCNVDVPQDCRTSAHIFRYRDGQWIADARVLGMQREYANEGGSVFSEVAVSGNLLLLWPTYWSFYGAGLAVFEHDGNQWNKNFELGNNIKAAEIIDANNFVVWDSIGGLKFYEKTAQSWQLSNQISRSLMPYWEGHWYGPRITINNDRLFFLTSAGLRIFLRSGRQWLAQFSPVADKSINDYMLSSEIAVRGNTVFVKEFESQTSEFSPWREYLVSPTDTNNPFIADIGLTLEIDPPIELSTPASYRIVITNFDTNNVTHRISVSHWLKSPDKATISSGDKRCKENNKQLNCFVKSLLPGESVEFVITVTASFGPEVVFQACVNSSTTDSNADNNCAIKTLGTTSSKNPEIAFSTNSPNNVLVDYGIGTNITYSINGWQFGDGIHNIGVCVDIEVCIRENYIRILDQTKDYPTFTLDLTPGKHTVWLVLDDGTIQNEKSAKLQLEVVEPSIEILQPINGAQLIKYGNAEYRLAFAIAQWPLAQGEQISVTINNQTRIIDDVQPIILDQLQEENNISIEILDRSGNLVEYHKQDGNKLLMNAKSSFTLK